MATTPERPLMDLITGPASPYVEPPLTEPVRLQRRAKVFLLVFTLIALPALLFTFLREPVYRSSAALLVEPPVAATRGTALPPGAVVTLPAGGTNTTQFLATELQRVLSEAVLEPVANDMHASLPTLTSGGSPLAILQTVIDANYTTETSLLDMHVEGPQPDALAPILQRWLASYQAARETSTAVSHDSDSEMLRGQLAEMQAQIDVQKRKVDGFRREHGIVSSERTDNRELARLKGLNDAINRAEEEEVKAAARLDSVRAAIAAGEPVTQGSDRAALERLEERVMQLRDQVLAYDGQFTEKYAQIAPEILTARENLQRAEADLAAKRREGVAEALATADHDLVAARASTAALVEQQGSLKSTLTQFGERFEEFATLQRGLAEIEAQAIPLRERLTRAEVAANELYPKVTLVGAPSTPTRPIRPAYWRDASISVGAAFALALFATWFYEFLNRPPPGPSSYAMSPPDLQPRIYSYNTQLFPPPNAPPTMQLAQTATGTLPSPASSARELMPSEIADLLALADKPTKLLMGLLLCGASGQEIAQLRWSDLRDDNNLSANGRVLCLAPACWTWLQDLASQRASDDGAIFVDAVGNSLSAADLRATLTYLAHDAGISRPEDISLETLRHTYFAYLVRQGLKLGQLPAVGGAFSPVILASYAGFSPPGAGLTLDAIDPVYPVLKNPG